MEITVRKGDSFWYFSQLFQLPLQFILDSNPGMDPNSLKIGKKILIPGFIAEEYTIKQGDTLWKLAQKRNMSMDALLVANSSVHPKLLKIGQQIVIPKRIVSRVVQGQNAYDFSLFKSDVDELKKIYPFIHVDEIGKSVDGLPIYEIKIGKGRKKVHFNGSFHANEWITTPVIMTFLNDYLLSLTNYLTINGLQAGPFYDFTTISFVPMVNPDGVNLVINGPPAARREELMEMNKGSSDFNGWKANIRGVDLNNQYPANWEIEKERKEEKAPAPRDFPGYKPLSEPEAIAMAELANKENFDRLLAFHTQGKELYWGYEGLEPEISEKIAQEFARVSGYKSVRYVDSHAGYKDWFIQEFRKPGFTIELGKGINPLPLSQFPEIYRDVRGIFLASLYM
ncbi:g-D-glutamyl-meso-diaminopimelate peptidase [Oikeobacillus pervagus]|uniref:G-D-glutamyl-meso-diaminopimelate peptidase n=1 Tax=Oikeobacillus pervagus TaxID=1325931 RepID=A0AAJ1T0T6_9BACI|nr:M14 family metallopeptidase [Oikeobacillus pervagus]MDQ0213864.1 g-D-glutamyl-meso-diaminopimelate peptidase [Oikeobacillus pervagus]